MRPRSHRLRYGTIRGDMKTRWRVLAFAVVVAVVASSGVAVASALPEGGPFVNEKDYPSNAYGGAYYWVDVVSSGDSIVEFSSGTKTKLPDPAFHARAGQTNRVVLQISKPYVVSSMFPVECVATSSPDVKVGRKDPRTIVVRYPVQLGADGRPKPKKDRAVAAAPDGLPQGLRKVEWKGGSETNGPVFFVEPNRRCLHWREDVPKRFSELTDAERKEAEDAYECALWHYADKGTCKSAYIAYDALFKAARMDYGRAQFLLALTWDFGRILSFPIKFGAPTFCDRPHIAPDGDFCNDHNGCRARSGYGRGSTVLATPICNGDFARKARFWYSKALANGVKEAKPFIDSIDAALKKQREFWLGRCDPNTGTNSPLECAVLLVSTHAVYKDVELANEILEAAADRGDGAAALALALVGEARIEPSGPYYDRQFREAFDRHYFRGGAAMEWEIPNIGLTNATNIATVEGLYNRAIGLGNTNAVTELKRFRIRVKKRRELDRFVYEREAVARRRAAREEKNKLARKPLEYVADPSVSFDLAGFELGKKYPAPKGGSVVIYGNTVREFTPQEVVREPYHGMDRLFMRLTPKGHLLFSLSMRRQDFKDREELLREGESLRADLGKKLGKQLAAFRYEAPDWPYWPSRHGDWSGPLPELYAVDESHWATSKTVFAISDTRIGDVFVQVELEAVNSNEYALGFSIVDERLKRLAEDEFNHSFRIANKGKTWAEWSSSRGGRAKKDSEGWFKELLLFARYAFYDPIFDVIAGAVLIFLLSLPFTGRWFLRHKWIVVRAVISLVIVWPVIFFTFNKPLFVSNSELETVGAITYLGWPLPWMWCGSRGHGLLWWNVPIGFMIWHAVSLLLLGFRKVKHYAILIPLLTLITLAAGYIVIDQMGIGAMVRVMLGC